MSTVSQQMWGREDISQEGQQMVERTKQQSSQKESSNQIQNIVQIIQGSGKLQHKRII